MMNPMIQSAFCHVCTMSFKLKRMKSSTRADPAFVTRGFHNWKDATMAFRNHEHSACHAETMVTIPSTVPDVGEMLSHQHASEKVRSRHALHEIMNTVKFLSRQALPLRGDKDECDSNMAQLLKMKAERDQGLAEWLKRKYTSPTIQNEMIKIMGISILHTIASTLQSTPFLTVMADETTDIFNKEQVTMFLRWVTDNFQVHEEFLGLYHVNFASS